MKTIMKDIAKLAGVSPGTVSNTLNKRKGVRKETKERIIKIAEELGYYKKNGKTESRVIRFIIYKKHGYVVSDTPFFSALIEGIERACRTKGYEMLVSHIIFNEHDNAEILKIVNENQVAGILLLATEMSGEDLAPFKNLDIPVVVLDSYFLDEDFDSILINNRRGAYQAVKHLIENGHTKIGCLESSKPINNFAYRVSGFTEALRDAGISDTKQYHISLEPTLEGAYRDMKEYLQRKDCNLPTAFFALNDIIAFGAITAMKEQKIKIPEQVSIIGFDDMPFCEISSPRLTTLRVYKQYMGETAITRLIKKISGQDDRKLTIELNTELILRDSVQNLSLK